MNDTDSLLFEPIEGADITRAIVDQISRLVAESKLETGLKLPGERELVKQLRVSRTSLREGLRMLQAMGIIEILPGKGTFIRDINDQKAKALENLVRLFADDTSVEAFSDLYQVRLMLETEAAGLAAKRATPEFIEKLRESLNRFAEAVAGRDPSKMAEKDIEFHRSVALVSRNELLLNFQDAIIKALRDSRELDYFITYGNHDVVEKHVKIFEAICSRKPRMARQLMKNHIIDAYDLIKKYYVGVRHIPNLIDWET